MQSGTGLREVLANAPSSDLACCRFCAGMSDQAPLEEPLVCAECSATSPPEAKGWRCYITVHGEAVMFCPACAEREFPDGSARGDRH
jgi:hypothetical protein